MYQNLAILAVFAFLYSTFAKGIEKTWVSGPIIFTAFGLLLGPIVHGVTAIPMSKAIVEKMVRH